jgi:hypothetical protein
MRPALSTKHETLTKGKKKKKRLGHSTIIDQMPNKYKVMRKERKQVKGLRAVNSLVVTS